MKFRRTVLIEHIDRQIEDRTKVIEETNERYAAAARKAREEWTLRHAPEVVEFANRVKKLIRQGKVVTYEDLPQDGGRGFHEVPYYRDHESEPKEPGRDPAVRQLTTLRSALDAMEDEFVSTSSLASLGFRNVARLFEASR